MDKIDKYRNQAWSQITEDDQHRLEATGFAGSIQDKPRLLKAGWMKTTGRGGERVTTFSKHRCQRRRQRDEPLYSGPGPLHYERSEEVDLTRFKD